MPVSTTSVEAEIVADSVMSPPTCMGPTMSPESVLRSPVRSASRLRSPSKSPLVTVMLLRFSRTMASPVSKVSNVNVPKTLLSGPTQEPRCQSSMETAVTSWKWVFSCSTIVAGSSIVRFTRALPFTTPSDPSRTTRLRLLVPSILMRPPSPWPWAFSVHRQ